jgi:hypothetical protein
MEIKSEESPVRWIQTGDSLRISNAARFDKSQAGGNRRRERNCLKKQCLAMLTADFPGRAAVFVDFLC